MFFIPNIFAKNTFIFIMLFSSCNHSVQWRLLTVIFWVGNIVFCSGKKPRVCFLSAQADPLPASSPCVSRLLSPLTSATHSHPSIFSVNATSLESPVTSWVSLGAPLWTYIYCRYSVLSETFHILLDLLSTPLCLLPDRCFWHWVAIFDGLWNRRVGFSQCFGVLHYLSGDF